MQEMVIFYGQIHRGSVTRQPGNDPAMFSRKPRGMKREPELFPARGRIGHDAGLFGLRQSVHRRRQSPNGLLHAFVRRGQFQPGIKGFEVSAKLILKDVELVRHGRHAI